MNETPYPYWTKADQITLEAMQERKRQAELIARKPIERIVEEIYSHNIFPSEITSGLIERADRLVAALKPFCREE